MGNAPVSEYGRLYGVVTPMANPTVEAELTHLVDGVVLAARAVSRSPDSRQRLFDYIDAIELSLDSFDVAPLAAAGFACTCYYLRGATQEAEDMARLSSHRGFPVWTSTTAIRRAFSELGVSRFALLAPYPAWLADEALRYFASVGLTVTTRAGLPRDLIDTRGIYKLTSADVLAIAERMDIGDAEAVLLGGTGMPSLRVVAGSRWNVPVLSSNIALAAAMMRVPITTLVGPGARWRKRLMEEAA